MKSTMEKAGQVQRKWYVIDAAGKSVGRVFTYRFSDTSKNSSRQNKAHLHASCGLRRLRDNP